MSGEDRRVIFASSLGTIFEWYDFYLYGALAAIIGEQFFSALDESSAFIFALLAFSAGFVVRPFGALVFGRLGVLVGRKSTFLITIVIMGLSTFIVGILPGYASIGVAAPVILIGLRLMQGLAMGGEYGGAVIYVAEHAPRNRRGVFTAWIQTTASLGLLLALVVIWGTRSLMGEALFADWGWRIPFLASILMLGITIYIRIGLGESPVFTQMKARGAGSKAPVAEAFGRWSNLKKVLVALFGLTAGQAVIWYTGHFYALFFLTQSLGVDEATAIVLMAVSLALGSPFFVVFGALSDRVGRKPIILAGCLLATFTYMPVFDALTQAANPALHAAQRSAKVTIYADPSECSFQFNLTDAQKFASSCDIAKRRLASASVSYSHIALSSGAPSLVTVGSTVVKVKHDPQDISIAKAEAVARLQRTGKVAPVDAQSKQDDAFLALSNESAASTALFHIKLAQALREAGYPEKADMQALSKFKVVLILTYLVLLVTMVYGPMAAMLVELFPTRIRYTSMSLPYHIGNGWFGGLLPATVFAIVAETGNSYSGLWYPIAVAGATVVVGAILLRETKDVDLGVGR